MQSSGVRRSAAALAAFFALSRGRPVIDPERSTTSASERRVHVGPVSCFGGDAAMGSVALVDARVSGATGAGGSPHAMTAGRRT
jgi:hypothetical protein